MQPDSLGCFERPRAAAPSAPGDSVRGEPAADTREYTGDRASIVLRAEASAREVRFARQPQIRVRLCGGVLDSVHVVERRNLPDPVQPGVTYRDVFIAVEILGHLRAQCLVDRITGTDTTGSRDCASLQLRDSTGRQRSPP